MHYQEIWMDDCLNTKEFQGSFQTCSLLDEYALYAKWVRMKWKDVCLMLQMEKVSATS